MAEGSNNREIPQIRISRSGKASETRVTPVNQSVSDGVPAERPRIRGILSAVEVQQGLERAAQELEERYRRGEEPRIKRVGLVIESDRRWESQLNAAAREQRLLTCVLTSFENALRSMEVYNPELDSQAQLIQEVRDLFLPDGSGVDPVPALDRLTRNRASRNVRFEMVNFQSALDALLEGKAVVHGHSGHMVFIQRLEARRNPESGQDQVGVRVVDPLQQVVKSRFVPLSDLAREEGFYRAFSIAPSVPSRIRIPPRPR